MTKILLFRQALFLDTKIKIEYENKSFHRANLVVESIVENDKSEIVKLHSDSTQCKASDNCCTPIKNEKIITTCC